jgi:hypothetical protein
MAEVATALATPSEKGVIQTLAIVADLLAENASLKQKNAAAGEERVHAGIQVAALENVIKERERFIKHLVGLYENANTKNADGWHSDNDGRGGCSPWGPVDNDGLDNDELDERGCVTRP